MIRGVKKQIIEVLNTENEYFERAILVVSDEYSEYERSKLDRRAREYVSSLSWGQISDCKRKKRGTDRVGRVLGVLKYFAVSGLGAAVTYFIVR
ncbi:MAG: hypothetical protein UHH95_01785 [Oscillospiraceae bacterium]|nr:hypothetical protein [Oscillospiraceae bacterium]